jgi:hypothetical protein
MIQNSFIVLPRIGKQLERNIWKQGIKNWDDFLNKESLKGLSKIRKRYYDRLLYNAKKALYSFDSSYFLNLIPQSEMWRLYDFFKDEAVFLDIETTGMSNYDSLTVIGLFNGINTKIMIKDINLDLYILRKELQKYKLIVTFNGALFDIPFIKKRYPNLLPNIPNFDLRTACERIGLSGGLKEIEKKLNIKRNKIIERFYSGDALTLWKMYKVTGDEYYLNLLVEYNEEDVINLKKIADHVVGVLKNKN